MGPPGPLERANTMIKPLIFTLHQTRFELVG